MSLPEALLLLTAGFFAGLVGFVTGLASLVSYPALLAVGLPPVAANVTNTVALVGVGAGALANSGRDVFSYHRRRLVVWALCSIVGGLIGAVILLLAPADSFAAIVPFLVALAALALLLQPRIRALARGGDAPRAFAVTLLAVSVYGGYFGAGAGVMFLAAMLLFTSESIVLASIMKSFLLGLSNLVAAIYFAISGPVHWMPALVMGAGALVGGYAGPPVVRRVPADLLRWTIAAAGFALAAWLWISR